MGKMDEMILAVKRDDLFGEDGVLSFEGVITKSTMMTEIMENFSKYKEVRRGDVEDDVTYKQPIPYAIIKRGNDIFLYERLKGGGEARLHGTSSIGVGGHMNRINDVRDWTENLNINLFRELGEELNIITDSYPEPKVIGLINTDGDKGVGQFHIGILMLVELDEYSEVTVRETDSMSGRWVDKHDLVITPQFAELEVWSRLAALIL